MICENNKMGIMPIKKLVFSISIPLMISMFVQSLYNIVDGIFVARISEEALTATSLALPVQMLMIAISVGTGVGVNSLVSRKLGQGKNEEISQVATNGLFIALLCYFTFCLLGIFCVPAFIGSFTGNPMIVTLSIRYLRICMVYSFGIFLATTGERLLQATGKTLLSMLAQSAGALVNIALDPLLIFGYLGLPKLGISGAASATVIGQCVAAILSLWFNKRMNKEIYFSTKGFKPNLHTIRAIYKVGFPTMLMQAMGSIMVVCMNTILLPFSSTAVAIFGIYYKLQNFMFMLVNGFAQGMIPIVGYNFGAKKGRRIIQAFSTTLITTIFIMLLGMSVFLSKPESLLKMFNASDVMLEMGIPAIRIASVTFVFTAVTTVTGFAFSGMGNGMVGLIGTFIRQLGCLVPCAYLLARFYGLNAIWYATWISELLAVIYSLSRLVSKYKNTIKPLS